jgi:hypothetical protein
MKPCGFLWVFERKYIIFVTVKSVLARRHKETRSLRFVPNTFKRSFTVVDIFENKGKKATQFLPYSNNFHASFVLVSK